MKKVLLITTVIISCALIQSCIFVIHTEPKGELTTTDSSKALSPIKESVIRDSIRKENQGRDSLIKDSVVQTTPPAVLTLPKGAIDTKNVQPQQVVDFAKTLFGVRYKYGSSNPAVGFDCSGFITYVFGHFNIIVPRSSRDFTHVGKEVRWDQAKPGDIILFTGTDSTERFVGHMGIVITSPGSQLQFIHSSSGKANGVTISPLAGYYQKRFVKVIRIFPQNG
jgi:cell wall-associated NlpC family hydrolase